MRQNERWFGWIKKCGNEAWRFFVRCAEIENMQHCRKNTTSSMTSFAKLVDGYPETEQDILWAFVCLSEQMNWRMLEWLCDKYGIEA